MSSNRFLTLVNGVSTLLTAIAASVGVGDANKIVMTGSDGRLGSTLMPTGVGAQTTTVTTTEALAAGDWVNVVAAGARKADNSNGRFANGFVLSAFASGVPAVVYSSGLNTARSGLTVGLVYFLGVGGAETLTAPASTPGAIVQILGVALTATSVPFDFDPPITIV